MIKIALGLLLLALTGCVDAMPTHDENNRLLNQMGNTDAPTTWMPRKLFE